MQLEERCITEKKRERVPEEKGGELSDSYQSSSAVKFTALSRCVENSSIRDTKSLIITLSISSPMKLYKSTHKDKIEHSAQSNNEKFFMSNSETTEQSIVSTTE